MALCNSNFSRCFAKMVTNSSYGMYLYASTQCIYTWLYFSRENYFCLTGVSSINCVMVANITGYAKH